VPARVLLLARELNIGGSERQMTETARFLDRTQFEPRIGCFLPAGMRGAELRAAGVPVVQFAVHSYKSWAAVEGARELARYIRLEHIQLVHAFDYPLNVFAVPVARWFTPAVAVASQRSHRELVPEGYRLVVNCEYLRKHLIDEEHVAPDRVQVCYNGIDLSFFCPGESPRPPELENASLVIGVVCGLRPEKGLPLLLEAFARVRPLRPKMKLAIVGSGPVLGELNAQAARMGISEDCVFQPGTSEVPTWLRAIDIFVLPSLSEAFSNALMEAMACGCCAVASDTGGNPELIRPGETGLLFERGSAESLAAALRRVIENEDLRRRLTLNSTQFIHDNFSAQAAARRMGEIYSGLLARHGKFAAVGPQEPHAADRR
jgi:glycosyltransferase involved in cell wall biosynthesis